MSSVDLTQLVDLLKRSAGLAVQFDQTSPSHPRDRGARRLQELPTFGARKPVAVLHQVKEVWALPTVQFTIPTARPHTGPGRAKIQREPLPFDGAGVKARSRHPLGGRGDAAVLVHLAASSLRRRRHLAARSALVVGESGGGAVRGSLELHRAAIDATGAMSHRDRFRLEFSLVFADELGKCWQNVGVA